MTEDDKIEENEQETIQSVKQPNFLVPDPNEIKNVVLLPSELSKNYETKLQPNLARFEFEESLLPEIKPLAFTVGENFFDLTKIPKRMSFDEWKAEREKFPENKIGYYRFLDSPNIFLEKRGLLQFVNERKKFVQTGDSIFDGFEMTDDKKHIELQFPARNGFKTTEWEREKYGESHFNNLAKTKIYFDDIESISITKGFFRKDLIIKLKPERKIHRLFIDKVEREIIITVERKHHKLAEQVTATILTQINEIELRKIL